MYITPAPGLKRRILYFGPMLKIQDFARSTVLGNFYNGSHEAWDFWYNIPLDFIEFFDVDVAIPKFNQSFLGALICMSFSSRSLFEEYSCVYILVLGAMIFWDREVH